MDTKIFTVFYSILVSGLLWAYSSFQSHFQNPSLYIDQIKRLKQSIQSERLSLQVAQDQYLEFKQQVALLIPKSIYHPKKLKEEDYPLRNLASIVSKPASDKVIESISSALFERGKIAFKKGDYGKSDQIFDKLINEYSFSIHIIEALFLQVESRFLMGEYESCLKVIEKMIQLYPESELTGLALTRMGKIFQMQNRPAEAIEVFETVIKTFPQRGIASEAASYLREVNL